MNIMLKLKNIKKNNGTISAEYDPENSGDLGNLTISIENGELIEFNSSKLDDPLPIYLHHAVEALKKMLNGNEVPEEKLIMWC